MENIKKKLKDFFDEFKGNKKKQMAVVITICLIAFAFIFGYLAALSGNKTAPVSDNKISSSSNDSYLAADDKTGEAYESENTSEDSPALSSDESSDEETTEDTNNADDEDTTASKTLDKESDKETKKDKETGRETKEEGESGSKKETKTEKETEKETKKTETKPAQTQPVQTKPAETKPAQTQPVQTKPAQTQPSQQPAVKPEKGTPLENHGRLSVSGTTILDKNGEVYQLKGVSTHGIAWFPDYVNKAAFQTMRDEWGINVVRLAMYTAEYAGYCEGGDRTYLKNLIDTGVKAATELGLYVIIDWHILNDCNPHKYKSEAISFFNEIAAKYASYDNVIYEICNEPNRGPSWADVKSYAEEVIPVIRKYDNDAIIIVGTTTWSQDVDQAAANPIVGQHNLMYALHFYAATHKDDLRNKLKTAVNAGLPLFVSEFGSCDASGNGYIDKDSANTWIALLNQNHISFCVWSLCNKAESASLISSGCSKKSGWTEADLSEAGKWFVSMMKGNLSGLGVTNPGSGQEPQQTQPQQTQPPQSEYVPPTTQAPMQANSGNCSVDVKNTSSWGDSSQGYFSQLDISVSNTSQNAVTGWKVVITLSGNAEVNSSWNGVVTAGGSSITIAPDSDWNTTIQPGAVVTSGLIIKSSSEVKVLSCKIQ